MSRARTRTVDVVDGVEIFVRLDGDPSDPPVVMLHGYMNESEPFDPVASRLVADGFFVVRPDHRGHGHSTDIGDESAYSFEHLLDDALVVTDRLGLDRFHLVGHSMGGYVAQMMAIRHPDRLRSIALVGSSPMPGMRPGRIGPPLRRFIGYRVGPARLVRWLTPVLSRLSLGSEDKTVAERRAGLRQVADSADRHDPAAFVALGEELRLHDDLRPHLPSIDIPTIVIVGDAEFAKIRVGADAQAELIPGASMAVIERASHGVPMEQPDAFSDALIKHLRAID